MIRIRAATRDNVLRDGRSTRGVEIHVTGQPALFLTRQQQRDLIIKLAMDYEPDMPEAILSEDILEELAEEMAEAKRAAAAGDYA